MNKNYGLFGIGKQTAVGSPVAPTVSILASTDVDGIDVSTSTEPVKLTNGMRDTTAGRYIASTESSAKVATIGFADYVGLLLYTALGKDEVSGEAAPYTHDITMGESLPYITVTQQVGASNASLQQLESCKLDSLSISAEGTKPPTFDATFKGTKTKWLPATAWTGPEFNAAKGWFLTSDAEVLFSLIDGEPVVVPVEVVLSSIAFKIENAVESTTGFGQIEPSIQTEKSATVTVDLSGTTSSTDLYRAVKTGSNTGTEIAKKIVTGALQVTFKHSREPWEFTVKLGAIPWTINAMGVSTEGGPFALTLSTDGAISVDGTSIEFILQNDVASY